MLFVYHVLESPHVSEFRSPRVPHPRDPTSPSPQVPKFHVSILLLVIAEHNPPPRTMGLPYILAHRDIRKTDTSGLYLIEQSHLHFKIKFYWPQIPLIRKENFTKHSFVARIKTTMTVLINVSYVLALQSTVEPRLSELFLWSQFGYDYLLVTIKSRSHILFKTTALKGAVKCMGFSL